MNHGGIISIGYTERVLNDYRINMRLKEEENLRRKHEKIIEQMTDDKGEIKQAKDTKVIFEKRQTDRWGSREIEITDVQFYNKTGDNVHLFKTGEEMHVRIKYFAKKRIEKPVYGVAIYRNDGLHMNGANIKNSDNPIDYVEGEGEIEYVIDLLPLLEGTYFLSAAVYNYEITNAYDHHHLKFKFNVYSNDVKDDGIIYIPCKWNHE